MDLEIDCYISMDSISLHEEESGGCHRNGQDAGHKWQYLKTGHYKKRYKISDDWKQLTFQWKFNTIDTEN